MPRDDAQDRYFVADLATGPAIIDRRDGTIAARSGRWAGARDEAAHECARWNAMARAATRA